jgi:poly(hydroxyalkanoate) depolymerase family esterase
MELPVSLAENVDYLKRLRELNGFAGFGERARNLRQPPRSPLTETEQFGANPGELKMFSYVPSNRQPSPALVVVLHGCGQTAAGYDLGAGWSTLARHYGFALLMPEQQRSNNVGTCFNWFKSDDIARDRGEAGSIREMIARMVADHHIDKRRIFITGLSAGGAMSAVMLANYPELFAAGAIIAGLPFGVAHTMRDALFEMHHSTARPREELGDLVRRASEHTGPWPRLSVWHGSADRTVHPGNADEIVKQWLNLHELPSAPMSQGVVDGYPREVWWNADGETVVESYTITDMAHGTPLGVADNDQRYGTRGAYLIEAGISSSFHIAKFFGLTSWIRERKAQPAESPSAKLIPPVAPATATPTPMQNVAKMMWPAETPAEQAPEPPPVQLKAPSTQPAVPPAEQAAPPLQQPAPRRRLINMTAAINRVLVAAGLRKQA